jgi:pimeloyl-ACP methyl ester carboxylesterase
MIDVREIGGLKIACWVNRDGFEASRKTLVFIHGSGGDHTVWVNQYGRLKDDFNIAALDMPGHGRSEGGGEREVSEYLEWVVKILEQIDARKPVLIGHSIGAAISLAFALKSGDRLSGIVPVGGGATMPVNPAILDGLKADPAAVIAMASKIAVAKANRERLSPVLAESMSRVNPETLYGDFLACSRFDVTETVSRIRVPTLIVCGDEDKMTPPAMSQNLKEQIPGARLAMIGSAGHFPMLENPEAFNGVLRGFVESLP